jgi:hypothetical protein
MKDLKIRCSAIGKIMTSPRSKGEVLSATTKTYIKELVLEHKYGIKKEINSRYLDKGNQVEDMAIARGEASINDLKNNFTLTAEQQHDLNMIDV